MTLQCRWCRKTPNQSINQLCQNWVQSRAGSLHSCRSWSVQLGPSGHSRSICSIFCCGLPHGHSLDVASPQLWRVLSLGSRPPIPSLVVRCLLGVPRLGPEWHHSSIRSSCSTGRGGKSVTLLGPGFHRSGSCFLI